MQSFSLDKKDVIALNNSKCPGVTTVLSGTELGVLNNLSPSNLNLEDKKDIQMTLEAILSSVRALIFDGVELPLDFPTFILPDLVETFSDIGIVATDSADIEQIQNWVLDTLAECKGLDRSKIENLLRFDRRSWLDGEISVDVIRETEFDETKNSLYSI